MNRSLLNLIIDLLAAANLLVMIATGYILRFPLPPSTNRTHALWNMSRHEWGTIHSWASIGLLTVLCIHLVLHWDWLFAMVRRRFTKTKAALGARFRTGMLTLGALVTAGGLFAWAAHAGVQELGAPLHPLHLSDVSAVLPPDRGSREQAVDFQRVVLPIFEATCMGCHGPKKQRAGFRVDRRENFFAPGDAAPLIVPGMSERSRLITIVSGGVEDMKSAEEHLLPLPEIVRLKAWIDAGADWPKE